MTPNQPPVYNGRYELRSQIARGGTAQVYLARDLILDRPVALKVLFPEFATDHSFVERFRREGQAAANLSHPNIVPVFDWGESDRSYFIVMEYVDGEPLSSIIRTEAPLAPGQAASIAADIAKALSYAHRHGVVHRDVKPGNVLITSDGQVKVTDFGIARAIGTDEQVTQTGLVMGTATYFSPEQAQGLAVDGRSDIYALGVVLYEMVVGKPPFTGDNPVSIAYQHVREQPVAPRTLVPELPAALEAIIQQAMAKLPAERYATAQDLQADLDRFVRGITVLAVPPRHADAAGGPPTALSAGAYAGSGAGGTGGVTTAMPIVGDTGAVPADDGWRPPKEKRTTGRWVAAGLLLLAAIAVAVVFGGRALGYFGGNKYFTVPDVRGVTTASAEHKLEAKGLVPHVVKGAASLTKAGHVISQSPEPPGTVAKGQPVTITVATPEQDVTVPNVVNSSYAAAANTLQQHGFKPATRLVQATNASQQQGTVIGQQPSGGTTRPSNTTVTLDVVRGQRTIPVPSVTGQNELKATAAIGKSNLNLGTVTKDFSPTVPAGDVISQSPLAGTGVFPGQSVGLDISEGAGATIPSLAGYSLAQAERALKSQGFTTFDVRYAPTAIAGYVGNVLYTSPAASRVVRPGIPIIIVIGITPSGSSGTGAGSATIPAASSGSSGSSGTTSTVPGNSGNPAASSGTIPTST